jgi:phosphatidylserine decarboxylase
MLKKIFIFLQSLLPQHVLSTLAGRIADSEQPWLKNRLITWFVKFYQIDLKEAVIEDALSYPSFNSFFIRRIKPSLRPISQNLNEIICPVDGVIAQIGRISQYQLLQAKQIYFDLFHLLGRDNEQAAHFYDGYFSTLYLAPHNFHRVYMPIDGTLLKTIYVPGRLFSVNNMTAQYVPRLYARNERFISIFATEAGLMAVILVGAMIVGSIQTVWMNVPIRQKNICTEVMKRPFTLKKGEELGYFKLGSTVILLYEKNKINWNMELKVGTLVKIGEKLAQVVN